MDELPKFVAAYDTAHSTTGIEPSKVTVSGILTVWKRMNEKRRSMRSVKAEVRVG